MKKVFKFIGIAVLVAGISSAVASCEKQNPVESQEVTEAQAVDFSEITKSSIEEDLANSTAKIKEALESIASNLLKQLGDAADANKEVVDQFASDLFDMFTKFAVDNDLDVYDHDFSFVSSNKYFSLFTNVGLYIYNKDESKNESYINFFMYENELVLRDENGYFVDFQGPDFDLYNRYVKGQGFVFTTNSNHGFVVTVGKYTDDVRTEYSKATFERAGAGIMAANIDIYDDYSVNNVVANISFTYNFSNNELSPVVAWYNNIRPDEENPKGKTSIMIADVNKVIGALREMTSEYNFSKEEAEVIAAVFNDNVGPSNGEKGHAIVAGTEMYAIINASKTDSSKYNVLLSWGGIINIDPSTLVELLEKYFESATSKN